MKHLAIFVLSVSLSVTFSETPVDSNRVRIGLVLSAGGALGLVHIGVLNEMV